MPKALSSAAAGQLEDLELIFNALAHPARRQILLVLHYRGGEVAAGDIAARFACSWPTTTRHLGVLRDAGLVEMEQNGRQRMYRLHRDRLQGVLGKWLGHFDQPKVGAKKTKKTVTRSQ